MFFRGDLYETEGDNSFYEVKYEMKNDEENISQEKNQRFRE
jgi:hypothetical protein